mmetsp:Transcript_7962/g.9087  ORF Transcript_7962/g.9087 Transcript_7962/m.9087 type:complete len:169 (-) Transcript_7962:8-514(-)
MAGPEIDASNKNELPSTCSPTKKPTAASMATRPCVSSASRYLLRVFSSAFSANPKGSKNPTGSKAPTKSSAKALTAVGAAERRLTGAKAAVEPIRARKVEATNFILDDRINDRINWKGSCLFSVDQFDFMRNMSVVNYCRLRIKIPNDLVTLLSTHAIACDVVIACEQ